MFAVNLHSFPYRRVKRAFLTSAKVVTCGMVKLKAMLGNIPVCTVSQSRKTKNNMDTFLIVLNLLFQQMTKRV